MKTALVLQGGGVRGAYTSGVLDQMMIENITFDALYGVSAGAKNSQYFISHQIGEALKVDLFCISNKKAISFHNLIFEGGIISADYYNNYIMKEYAPLNDEFYKSTTKFYVGATNIITGEMKYFEKSSSDVRKAVTASCSIPLVQKIAKIDNNLYLDGGIAEAVPISDALNNYDKIVVVLTRPFGYREKENPKLNLAFKLKYKKYPLLLDLLLTQTERFNKQMDEIDELEKEGKIVVIRPSKQFSMGILEKDEKKIIDLYEMGKQDLIDKLELVKNITK